MAGKHEKKKIKPKAETVRTARANSHGALANNSVHIFVDDQNLFYGITNNEGGKSFRIDFGLLLLEAAKDSTGMVRPIASAYIAGVIPDDDYFWEVARNKGFEVRRGFLGTNNRSKQDDAYLVRDMTLTVCRKAGPSKVVLVAGDADYVPPLELSRDEGWRNEVLSTGHGVSSALENCVHEFRVIAATAIQKHR